MLQTLQAPPPRGSLQESALILLLMKQESIEHARFRALAQITIDNEKGVEAFEEYMKIAFPYLESAKSQDRKKFIDLLQKEASRGPIGVTAVPEPKIRSKLKRKMSSVTPEMKQRADKLYKKLGDERSFNG